jgi:hypothetical protein
VGREAMEQIIVEGFVSSFDYLQSTPSYTQAIC